MVREALRLGNRERAGLGGVVRWADLPPAALIPWGALGVRVVPEVPADLVVPRDLLRKMAEEAALQDLLEHNRDKEIRVDPILAKRARAELPEEVEEQVCHLLVLGAGVLNSLLRIRPSLSSSHLEGDNPDVGFF